VPASEHSDFARQIGGTPTVGSREHGTPEERWQPPGDGKYDDRIGLLDALPSQDEYREQEAAKMKELGPKTEPNTERRQGTSGTEPHPL
jgi:hypothetical protein